MFVTLDVLILEKSIEVREEQPLNINLISVTCEESKLDRSISVIFEHSLKSPSQLVISLL